RRASSSPRGTSKSGTNPCSPTSRETSSNRIRWARSPSSSEKGRKSSTRSRPRSLAAKRDTTASKLGNSSACDVARERMGDAEEGDSLTGASVPAPRPPLRPRHPPRPPYVSRHRKQHFQRGVACLHQIAEEEQSRPHSLAN